VRSSRIKIVRAVGELYHLAHQPGTCQREFKGRTDHWGRAEGFFPEAFAENNRLRRQLPVEPSERWGLPSAVSDVSLVLTHYRMPLQRLLDWIEWNDSVIRALRARAVVVSDVRSYDATLPDWLCVARFPRALSVFNLSATSNFGIRLIGRGIIAKVDPDLFLGEKFAETIAAVSDARGLAPRFRMAASPQEARDGIGEVWEASKGCLVMPYNRWAAICGYDERMEGYGIEDGDAFYRAGLLPGFKIDRECAPVWHVAHTAAPQLRGNNRCDCWGRDNRFNPCNHKRNQTTRRTAWESKAWGMGHAFD
jgi:hypothetical protein